MKKPFSIVAFLTLSAAFFFVAFACSPPAPAGNAPEFVGIWANSGGGVTETLTLTANSFDMVDSGAITGSLASTIDIYDVSARHIMATVTASSGNLSGGIPGTVIYITYAVSGNQLYWDNSPTPYPASATIGPYTKQ